MANSLQHGLHTMNATRPKSKLWKRKNKAKAAERKAPLLEALVKAKRPTKAALKGPSVKPVRKKVKKAPVEVAKAKSTEKAEPKAAAKKPAVKKAPAKAEQAKLV